MSKRNLFSELSSVLTDAKLHSENKLTLKTHVIETLHDLDISPKEIVDKYDKYRQSAYR